MNIHLNGFNQQVTTFIAGESIEPGAPVAISNSENYTAVGVLSESAGDFIGVCMNCREGLCAVQLQGYVELETDGSDISLGWQELQFDDNGKIITGGGHEYLVLNNDSAGNKVGFLL